MNRVYLLIFTLLLSTASVASQSEESEKVKRAVLDYIESQHQANPEMMARGLDKKLAKRTYWQGKNGVEFVMETDFETMVYVAENYNKKGDKFPAKPRVEIDVLDIDNRAASIKLTADEWIDYMHLYKNDKGEWKIINVLWQYHQESRHGKKK